MSEPLTLGAFMAFVGIGLALFLGFAWFSLSYLRSIDKSTAKIEAGMERAISELGRIFPLVAKPGNPHADKFELVRKLQEGRITQAESQQLVTILEKERDEAIQQRNWILLAAVVGLLVLSEMKAK